MIKKVFAIALMLIALCACGEKPEDKIVPVTSVTLSQPEAEMQPGETLPLKVQISPSNATEQKVMWGSSKQSVATVSDAGLVTAVGVGTATITATVDGKSATCKITVIKPEDPVVPVESVKLDKAEASLEIGGTLTLKATVLPENATDNAVEWQSSDPASVEVDQNGTVTAISEGSARITASAGGKTATCQITVTKPEVPVVHVENVTLDKSDAQLEIGQTLSLTATVLPDNADDKSVTWQSTNPSIAQVDQSGKVTAVSSGSVTVTVTTTDGGKMAACEVTVKTAFIPVESIAFEHDEYIAHLNDTYPLTVTVLPENATDKTITWSSSNPDIVSVTQDGMVTGHGNGEVTITARAGDKEATCTIIAIGDPQPPQPPTEDYDGEENGHRYVDLGLPSGIKWATRNVGASSPRDYGGYYAWGETYTKSSYGNDNYSVEGKYSVGPDTLTELEPQDDAAHVIMGGNWYTPSREEMQELLDNCTFENVYEEGKGRFFKVISKRNGKSLILPAGGRKVYNNDEYIGAVLLYWTSSVKADWASEAWSLNTYNIDVVVDPKPRFAGCPIRAITGRPVVAVESISLDKTHVDLHPNEQITLTATVLPENATDKSVTWVSTNPAIAEVDQQGNVTPKSPGTVTITATTNDGGKVAGCEVTVSADYVPVESVTIMFDNSPCYSLGAEKGTVMQFYAKVLPENASNKLVNWTSSNTDVVRVDQTGRIAFVGGGDAVVTAEAGGKTFDLEISVYVSLESITLTSSSLSMKVGQNTSLSAILHPADATNVAIRWESSNPNVVTVNDGLLTAVSAGEATVRAYYGNIEATCRVTVTSQAVPVESIRLDHYDIAVGKGESLKLTATVLPDNATDKTVTWSSTDTGVARVDAFGTATGVDAGEAFIVAKAGDKNVACRVSVIAYPERIDLNVTELTMTKGEKFTLVGTVYPPNANDRNVYYYADNSNVVMVGERTGEVYANKVGTGVVTAKNTSSGITATCTVTVVAAGPPGIILGQDSFTVDAAQSGDTRIPLQIVNPDGSSLQASSDASWLGTRVVGNGVTFYVAENRSTLSRTATITITYSTATATVTVKQKGKTPTGPPDIVFDDQFDPNANNGVHYSGEYDNVFYARVENPVEGVELQMKADVPWITNLRPTSNENWYCFTPTMNTTGRERTGHVILTYGSVTKTIKFVQQAGNVTIILNPGDMTTNYSAKTISFEVTLPEGFDYSQLTAELYDYISWVTDVAISGSTVTFKVKDNNSGSDRSARIRVSLGEHESFFNVTQTYDEPALTVLNPTMTVSYEGQKVAIPVSITNPRSSWTVDPHVLNSPGWIYGSPSDANGNPQVTVLANTTGADRTATVELYYGNCTATVQITQTASTTTITVPEEQSFGWQAIAYATNIQITDPLQNESLEVTPEVPWIKVNSIVEMSSTQVSVSLIIKKNRTGRARTGNVVFTYAHVTKTMVVSQEANPNIPDGFIDLGLASGTLWAEKNLGAANAYNFGNYYAWGEIATKSKYTWFNYKWASGSQPWNNITKYNKTDGKRELEPADDAATVANSHWTIPTVDQWSELLDQCSLVWVLNPVPGYMIYDQDEENYIFLPAAGNKSDDDPIETYCEYWSKSMNNNPDVQVFVGEEDNWYITNGARYFGVPIRPVWKQ